MIAEMKGWESDVPIVSDVRGRGLMIGMDLVWPGTRTLLDKRTTRWIFDTLLARGVRSARALLPPRVSPHEVTLWSLVIGLVAGHLFAYQDRWTDLIGFGLFIVSDG